MNFAADRPRSAAKKSSCMFSTLFFNLFSSFIAIFLVTVEIGIKLCRPLRGRCRLRRKGTINHYCVLLCIFYPLSSKFRLRSILPLPAFFVAFATFPPLQRRNLPPKEEAYTAFYRLNEEIYLKMGKQVLKNEYSEAFFRKITRTIILCVKNQKKAEIRKTNFGNLIFF